MKHSTSCLYRIYLYREYSEIDKQGVVFFEIGFSDW